jgi:YjbE family integral membrane protein
MRFVGFVNSTYTGLKGKRSLPSTGDKSMEILTMEFAAALAAIVLIDLVLAGDNAIVIALAARNVPRHLQRRAMLWGAAGAVLVRSLLTLMVVWLLQFPGLLFMGGALLIWIAYKLLLPEHENGEGTRIAGANTFWGAVKTIVIADMVMGLDNVLGVAGAAHGSFTLVILGLLISVPILIWGSSILLKYVERYPGLVYVGAGVLAFTAAKMMVAEPALKEALASYAFTVPLFYLVCVTGVLWAGFVENHRRLESRITARLARLKAQRAQESATQRNFEGESTMENVLVPVDGSRNAQHAIRHVINEFRKNGNMEIHLLNVQTPLSKHVAQFVSRKNRDAYHQDEAAKALRSIHRVLNAAAVPYSSHIEVGKKAEVIAETAKRLGCDHIVMATARKNSLTRMLEASVTNRVLELTTVPVEVIAGDAVSNLERYGIPTAVAATVGLMLFAVAD